LGGRSPEAGTGLLEIAVDRPAMAISPSTTTSHLSASRLELVGARLDGGSVAGAMGRSYVPPMSYEHLITIEPDKRSGKPCIRGMRITVYDVLEYLASGMTEDEILADFSELTREDIKACLAFAADRERKLFTAAA